MPNDYVRIVVEVDREVALWLESRSRVEDRPIAQVVGEILAEKLVDEEDERRLAGAGEDRLRSFDSAGAIEHDGVWGS